jgi:hypothetical protein
MDWGTEIHCPATQKARCHGHGPRSARLDVGAVDLKTGDALVIGDTEPVEFRLLELRQEFCQIARAAVISRRILSGVDRWSRAPLQRRWLRSDSDLGTASPTQCHRFLRSMEPVAAVCVRGATHGSCCHNDLRIAALRPMRCKLNN